MLILLDRKPSDVIAKGNVQRLSGGIKIQFYVGKEEGSEREYIHNITAGTWQYVSKSRPDTETANPPGKSLGPDGFYRLALPTFYFDDPRDKSGKLDFDTGGFNFVFVMITPETAAEWLRLMDSAAQAANHYHVPTNAGQGDFDNTIAIHAPDHSGSSYFDFEQFAKIVSEVAGDEIWPDMGSIDAFLWLPSECPDVRGRGIEVSYKGLVFTAKGVHLEAYSNPEFNYYKNPHLLYQTDPIRRETVEQMAAGQQLPERYELPWQACCYRNENYMLDQ